MPEVIALNGLNYFKWGEVGIKPHELQSQSGKISIIPAGLPNLLSPFFYKPFSQSPNLVLLGGKGAAGILCPGIPGFKGLIL